MAFNPFGLGFMIPSAEEIAQAIVAEEELRRSEEELRRSEEELRRSFIKLKKYVIQQMRDGECGSMISAPKHIVQEQTQIYPHISAEQEADLLESGELLFATLSHKNGELAKIYLYWADESREEAQHPWYLERKKKWEEAMAQEGMRAHFES